MSTQNHQDNGNNLTAARIAGQHIQGTTFSIRDLVSHMGAMQAQDYYGALWSIGLRTGKTEAQVISAIERAEIVRTWPQRGTLHFVAAEDALWMTRLSATRLFAGTKQRHERLELDEATLARSRELFANALQGNKSLTRPRMMELLEADGISTLAGRGYHMLWHAAQSGLIYIGAMEGKQQTFRLLADLETKQREMGREESVAELAKRYFLSHGPATLQDFVWWSGLTSPEAKAGLATVRPLLSRMQIDGKEHWFSADLPPARLPHTFLLPGFDEYTLGYKDRGQQMKPGYAARIVPGGNGMFLSTIVVDGQVVGTWKRAVKKNRVLISSEYFEPVDTAALASLEKTAKRYGEFLGLEAETSLSSPD